MDWLTATAGRLDTSCPVSRSSLWQRSPSSSISPTGPRSSGSCVAHWSPAALADELDVLVFEGRGIDHRPDELEGERFLVSDVAQELCSYPQELLLTRSWCAICRRGRADE